MADFAELGPAALGLSGTGHWLLKARHVADRLGDRELSERLEGLRVRADELHRDIAAVRRRLQDDEREAA